MAEMDIDFSQVNDIKIPQGQVKYIATNNLLWKKPNEFPYVIGAYTYTDNTGNVECFSPYFIEKYEEPIAVNAAYLPTYNSVINTSAYLMATSSLVGTLLNGYYCNDEADCQNLHIPSARRKLGNYAYTYWDTLDNKKHKILAYASKGQTSMIVNTPNPQHIEGLPTCLKYQYTVPLYLGAGFHIPYGEYHTPDLCRVLKTTTPIITIEKSSIGATGSGLYRKYATNIISSVREDYSDLITQYDEVTSGAYPKNEYPYLDGVTELGFIRVSARDTLAVPNIANIVFAFYVFFRVAR